MDNNNKFEVKIGLITPRIDFALPDSPNSIVATMLNSDDVTFNGDSGRLLSISDTLTGNVFSLNNATGVPIIEADDNGVVRIAETFGKAVIGNISIDGSTITHTNPTAVLTIQQQGSGYLKVGGELGMVIPAGDDVQRPAEISSEIGMTRFNIERKYLEIWNGEIWQSSAGDALQISRETARDISVVYALMLG
jgi:hypothetical protein